mmetsp:Transcript_42038/g.61790  ORF Transcript_42038/g.61790 Transcript_42038/m.61790 type:complete len:274 (+) Transcript_42038:554-1375(+)
MGPPEPSLRKVEQPIQTLMYKCVCSQDARRLLLFFFYGDSDNKVQHEPLQCVCSWGTAAVSGTVVGQKQSLLLRLWCLALCPAGRSTAVSFDTAPCEVSGRPVHILELDGAGRVWDGHVVVHGISTAPCGYRVLGMCGGISGSVCVGGTGARVSGSLSPRIQGEPGGHGGMEHTGSWCWLSVVVESVWHRVHRTICAQRYWHHAAGANSVQGAQGEARQGGCQNFQKRLMPANETHTRTRKHTRKNALTSTHTHTHMHAHARTIHTQGVEEEV